MTKRKLFTLTAKLWYRQQPMWHEGSLRRSSPVTSTLPMGPMIKRTASPLTPALSPLRGEGDAQVVAVGWRTPGRTHGSRTGAEARQSTVKFPSARCATPSPLNGERAGVRGGICCGAHRTACVVQPTGLSLALMLFAALAQNLAH